MNKVIVSRRIRSNQIVSDVLIVLLGAVIVAALVFHPPARDALFLIMYKLAEGASYIQN